MGIVPENQIEARNNANLDGESLVVLLSAGLRSSGKIRYGLAAIEHFDLALANVGTWITKVGYMSERQGRTYTNDSILFPGKCQDMR